MDKTPPSLPREHGAWVMLAIPLIVGSVGAGPPRLSSALIVPAMVLLFMARYAGLPLATRLVQKRRLPEGYVERRLLWSSIYMLASAALLGCAILLAEPGARAATVALAGITGALGSVHAGLALVGRDRRVWAELIGFAGLATAAPLVMAAAGRAVDAHTMAAAALCLSYFVSSLAYVRGFRMRKHDPGKAARMCVAVHALLVAAVAALWWFGSVPALGLVALGPMLARTVWGLTHPPAGVRALGFREIPVAVGFAVLTSVAFAP